MVWWKGNRTLAEENRKLIAANDELLDEFRRMEKSREDERTKKAVFMLANQESQKMIDIKTEELLDLQKQFNESESMRAGLVNQCKDRDQISSEKQELQKKYDSSMEEKARLEESGFKLSKDFHDMKRENEVLKRTNFLHEQKISMLNATVNAVNQRASRLNMEFSSYKTQVEWKLKDKEQEVAQQKDIWEELVHLRGVRGDVSARLKDVFEVLGFSVAVQSKWIPEMAPAPPPIDQIPATVDDDWTIESLPPTITKAIEDEQPF